MKIVLIILLTSLFLYAQEYVVISNKNMHLQKISKLQLKMIFLKKITILDDIKIVPLNLNINSEIRKSFEKNILNLSRQKLKSYWTREHYLGHRAPLNMKSTKSILSFIKKVDGAIGYIPFNDLQDSMHIIYKWKDD